MFLQFLLFKLIASLFFMIVNLNIFLHLFEQPIKENEFILYIKLISSSTTLISFLMMNTQGKRTTTKSTVNGRTKTARKKAANMRFWSRFWNPTTNYIIPGLLMFLTNTPKCM